LRIILTRALVRGLQLFAETKVDAGLGEFKRKLGKTFHQRDLSGASGNLEERSREELRGLSLDFFQREKSAKFFRHTSQRRRLSCGQK